MPTKRDKKNGKESNSIIAAVTKNGTKFSSTSNGNDFKGIASDTSSPSLQSPSLRAVATPSSNGNPAASPLLDAITSASFATSLPVGAGVDWTRGIPSVAGMAGSPGNLISLSGESPTTQPSSYEDPRNHPYGWSSPRSYMGSHPASASPPSSMRRPLSYQTDGRFAPSDVQSQASTAAIRRSSLHSHFASSRASPNPPLPHQPQAHFFGAPDVDFDIQPQEGMKAGERGYHFAFDALPAGPSESVTGKSTVVLAGYEGGLEVHSVTKRGLEHLASLKGLRGGVYNAKILPWTSFGDGAELFPLVALVAHGPILSHRLPDVVVEHDVDIPSRPQSMLGQHVDAGQRAVDCYQTTVEIYSLKTSGHIARLLEAPKQPLSTPITNPLFKPPPPTGALQIRADSGNLIVTSGVTGECWVYRQVTSPQEPGFQFVCTGKLWTCLQQPLKTDLIQESDRERVPTASKNPRTPILSLSGRWLAYCPATPSSQISLRAVAPTMAYGKAPGLTSLTPPQLPSIVSGVDLPISDSVVNKLMRDATQEIIKGAKWAGQQGWQALNNYWKGNANAQQRPQQARSPPLPAQGWPGARQEYPQFPPTHGTVSPPVSKEPGLVSIVDLTTLGNFATVHPIASFPAPQGCSFLSFSPTGLALFTASSKGDVQTLWDLMRIQYTKASTLQVSSTPPGSHGSRIRQIAQFSRMTVARIVDVAWTNPSGERVALVTERGTVHVFDIPSSAFTWPPPRCRVQPNETKATSGEGAASSAVSMASTAWNTAFDAARPLITRPRRSSSIVAQNAGSSIVDQASHGGKVIAASISHSIGKTGSAISQLRQTGEMRVSLPSSPILPCPRCIIWVTGRRNHSLFVLGDGLVRLFPSTDPKSSTGGSAMRMPRLNRHRDFKVPVLPDEVISSAVKGFVDPDEYLDLTEKEAEMGNNLVPHGRPSLPRYHDSAESSIPQAEIESSAPYQPFHTDRRVGLHLYVAAQHFPSNLNSVTALLAETTLEDAPVAVQPPKNGKQRRAQQRKEKLEDVWAFGQPICSVKLDLGHVQLSEQEAFNLSADDSRALPPSAMERVMQHVGEKDEQIVVTTRRRRGGARTSGAEDDGFFEDDCEVLDFADQRV